MTIIMSADRLANLEKICLGADASIIAVHARNKAADEIIKWARKLQEFAAKAPDTEPGIFCNREANRLYEVARVAVNTNRYVMALR